MPVKVITTVKEMQAFSNQASKEGKLIGFVPTMGYLHDGHISLVKRSNEICGITVVSIFVNPTQFGPTEDLAKYPRDFERDKKLLEENNCDVIFYPQAEEIYPAAFQTTVEVTKITRILEGAYRPNHFKGVTTVVSILFNSVKPDYAFFGQKDAQQAAVIKRMVKDLKMDINVHVEPIVRESDGLAMSSRNVYLSKEDRENALVLYKSLSLGREMIEAGENNTDKIIDVMSANVVKVTSAKLDYISIVKEETFESVYKLEKGTCYIILIACRIGATWLIVNLLITA
jgi:pantoate--beta-alanine ligase